MQPHPSLSTVSRAFDIIVHDETGKWVNNLTLVLLVPENTNHFILISSVVGSHPSHANLWEIL